MGPTGIFLVEVWSNKLYPDVDGGHRHTYPTFVAKDRLDAEIWCGNNKDFPGPNTDWHWCISEWDNTLITFTNGVHWNSCADSQVDENGVPLFKEVEVKQEINIIPQLATLSCIVAETNRQLGDLIEEVKKLTQKPKRKKK